MLLVTGRLLRQNEDMSKALSWNEIRSRIDLFVKDFEGESREHAEYASFWDGLLHCFGVQRRQVATFQKRAKRASNKNTGFIDFFWPKVVIGEHKSLGKMGLEGEKAEQQALEYLTGGSIKPEEFPRYVVSTDFEYMRVTDLEAADGNGTIFFPIANLREHAEQLAFLGGYQQAPIESAAQEAASIKAAKIMASLYEALTGDADQDYERPVLNEGEEEEETQRTAILLTRLLFLMFGDDAQLWEKGLFERFLRERTSEDGSDLGGQLTSLFRTLDTREDRRPAQLDDVLARFPYVNGNLFDAKEYLGLLAFDAGMRAALIEACEFDWSEISPAVFGSLFQAVKSKQARRLAGEHYTTEGNILKLLGPLFLDDLKARVRSAWNDNRKLGQIRDGLAGNIYCDPACGCGNFLVIAYRELRRVELQIMRRQRELTGDTSLAFDVGVGLRVNLSQFVGIEISWWPAKIAETAMFLVDHQANIEMAKSLGHAPERFPLIESAQIHHANALQVEWSDLIEAPVGSTYTFGNPPFVGHTMKSPEQRQDLDHAWEGMKGSATLDYVTGWHAKAIKLYDDQRFSGDWAYVTTNSIAQGDQVPTLFAPILAAGFRIKFGHRSFAWTSEAPGAAAVHCVIVGFSREAKVSPRLFDYESPSGPAIELAGVENISPYLIPGGDVLVRSVSSPLNPQLARVNFGTMPLGSSLIVESADHAAVAESPGASKYLRRLIGGRELVRGEDRWCLWLEDAEPSDISASPVLRERVEANRAWRSAQKSTGDAYKYRLTPHLFRPNKSRPTEPYVAIPRVVSEGRHFYTVAHLEPEVIATDLVFTMEDKQGFNFALLSSSMFITWQKTVGGRLESRLRFNARSVWYNFPLPKVSDKQRDAIIRAGLEVLAARELHPHRSLAEQYSPLAMDPTLVKAHVSLDRAVDRAFGVGTRIDDEAERQRILFASYEQLATANALPAAAKKKSRRKSAVGG